MGDLITSKCAEGIGYIELNDPKTLNALDPQSYHDLLRAAEQLDADGAVRVVVIYGAGRAFCSGDNISDGDLLQKRTYMETYEYIRQMQTVFTRIEQIGKPTIAAIHGACCGGGLELALSCDVRVAAESSKIGLPELKLGAIPCIGGTQRLPRLIGPSKAKELLFMSDLISAAEAERLGIVNRVVADGAELKEAIAMANVIKGKGALALRMAKRSVDKGLDGTLALGMEIEARNDAMLFDTHDFREGMTAFQEKREATFLGR